MRVRGDLSTRSVILLLLTALACLAPARRTTEAAISGRPLQATPTGTAPGLVEPGAEVRRLATGYGFTEGPAVAVDGTLYFSDVQGSRIHAMAPTGAVRTVRSNTQRANGLYFDADGNLVVCVMGGHRVERDDLVGGITVLADAHEGRPLVAPNDVWVHPGGGVYFTDPDFSGGGASSVFYLPPGGAALQKVVDDLNQPNGVIGTPDGSVLYVADYNGHTWRYDIASDGTLSGRAMLSFRPGDGMTMDERGNVYVASGHVWIHAADGTELGSIVVPEAPSNMTFGGPDGRTLYITAQSSVYAIRMTVRGAFFEPPAGTQTPIAPATHAPSATATATMAVTATGTVTATITATTTASAPTPAASPTDVPGTVSPTPDAGKRVYLPVALRLRPLPTIGDTPRPNPSPTAPFAPYVPVEVDVTLDAPPYEPELGQLANPDQVAGLSAAQRAKLASAGFVVVPAEHAQFYDLYVRNAEDGVPSFVTTDALLHTYHVLHNNALRGIEEDVLVDQARTLTSAMLTASVDLHTAAPETLESAALHNVAYFAVAARLLEPGSPVPDGVRDVVDAEIALIDGHDGVAPSPVFGYDEDYSQYVPRGHYNRSEALRRYFRAMMWYGRIAFRLDEKLPIEVSRRETRQALLIVTGLSDTRIGAGRALDVWDHIYDVTAFFVGTADDLTVHDYADLAMETYGHRPTASDLVDDSRLDAFMRRARTLRPPAILSTPIRPDQDPTSATMGFRFMGQRYIPDSDIFQQLIYDQVAAPYQGGEPLPFTVADGVRSFPRGLDVPAALGSARALEILTFERDTAYRDYPDQLSRVRGQFAALAPDRWSSNLYWSWLDTLRPLLTVPGEGYPFFMRAPEWVDKSLGTWLGSWSQLRHDSILYAKATMPVPRGLPGEPRGYVEPNPWLYARLAGLADQTRRGLDARDLLEAGLSARLDRLRLLLLDLKTISEKELAGRPITDDEYRVIGGVGLELKLIAHAGSASFETDRQIAVVADVHTVPLVGLALEEAVGDAFEVYVVVPEPDENGAPHLDRQIATVGAVFSYYEFKWPMSDRLTDESWQAMDPRPPLPSWTGSFVVDP